MENVWDDADAVSFVTGWYQFDLKNFEDVHAKMKKRAFLFDIVFAISIMRGLDCLD